MVLKIVISLLALSSGVLCGPTTLPPESSGGPSQPEDFRHHHVYQVYTGQNETFSYWLKELGEKIPIDFWSEPTPIQERVDFRVSPESVPTVEHYLADVGLDFRVLTPDLSSWVEREREENNATTEDMEWDLTGRNDVANFRTDRYHNFDTIQSYLLEIERSYPNLAEVELIGATHENRPLRVIRIGSRKGGALKSEEKQVFWIDAGIHAREWIAPATAIYMIHQMVTKYGEDPVITKLVDTYDFMYMPVINADGYHHTWTKNRMWRKNRAPVARPSWIPWNLMSECMGTDPNRNFDIGFGGASTSNNPCSEVYRGPEAFSEKETIAMRDKILCE